jgi:hypothetical protein
MKTSHRRWVRLYRSHEPLGQITRKFSDNRTSSAMWGDLHAHGLTVATPLDDQARLLKSSQQIRDIYLAGRLVDVKVI